jgi:collagenase-like PrtC family protease
MYLECLSSLGLIDTVIIANPYLFELLNWERMGELSIAASVNFQIKGSKSIGILDDLATYFIGRGKLTEVYIQKDLLRNLHTLRKIRDTLTSEIRLSIIINEGCLTGCPYQIVHQVHSSTFPISYLDDLDSCHRFGTARCKHIIAAEPWRFLDANWILPKHLVYYRGLIDSFKLTDRAADTKTIVDTVKAYVFHDYDKTNLNRLISLMRYEKWLFPEAVLPEDFADRIFSGEDPRAYYEDIWKSIVEYNEQRGVSPRIRRGGLTKEELHRYEGIA